MQLSGLLGAPVEKDFTVENVTDDSRRVNPGDVFVFDRRIIAGGEKFVAQALEKGAARVVTNMEETDDRTGEKKILFHPEPGQLLARWAKEKFPKQPQHLLGVTGTNGKTSVAWFVHQLLAGCGHKAACIGTLGIYVNGEKKLETGYTSPTALKLHEILNDLAEEGIEHVCMEVSSHALSLARVDGCMFEAAAFTNLTPDHRDFHGSMENYFAAKARLFTELLPENGRAVINIQKPESWPLASSIKQRGIDLLTTGTANAELTVQADAARGRPENHDSPERKHRPRHVTAGGGVSGGKHRFCSGSVPGSR